MSYHIINVLRASMALSKLWQTIRKTAEPAVSGLRFFLWLLAVKIGPEILGTQSCLTSPRQVLGESWDLEQSLPEIWAGTLSSTQFQVWPSRTTERPLVLVLFHTPEIGEGTNCWVTDDYNNVKIRGSGWQCHFPVCLGEKQKME